MANPSNYENRTTVMAKGGFAPEPNSSYSGDVFGVLISIFLIIGGLSGRMVLRGTNSSPALVAAGFALLAWDIISIFRKKSMLQKAGEERYARNSRMRDQENAVRSDERALTSQVNVRIICEKSLAALDFGARLNGSAMTRDIKAREYAGATGRVRNIVNFNNLDLTVVFDANPYATEITLDLFRDKAGIGIALPDDVTLIEQAQA